VVDARPLTVHSTEIVPRRPSTALRMVVQFMILSIVGSGLFLFHGISLHLTPWSQAVVNGIVKYVYKGDGQADTTVVLFREEHLAELGESYPVSYEGHAEVLEALSAYHPRAVFVDFAFVDRRSGQDIGRLNQAICGLRESGTAVYFAAPPTPAVKTSGHGLRDGLKRSCFEVVTAQMDVAQGVSGVLTYSNGTCTAPGPNRGCREFVWTPAFAMYDARKTALERTRLVPEDTRPMEIIWANRVSKLNSQWMSCTSERALFHLYHMLRKNPLAEKRKCPHTNTISVLHLLGPVNSGVQQAIEGKAVFYGGSFQMVGDRVVSPVYDDLPGVYLHAMAYDNLVTFTSDYKRADRGGLSLSSVVNGLLLLFTVLLLLLVDKPAARAKRLLGRLAGVSPRLKWLALGGAILCVLITVAIPTSLAAVFLLLPLLLGVVAVLQLATAYPWNPPSTRQFLKTGGLGVGVLVVAALMFLAVDGRYGIEAALLLVVLPAYFVYKTLVARDVLFVATTGLLIGAAIVSYLPPINLGPRNIVAYVAFFEMARRLMQWADDAAAKYFRLRQEHAAAEDWGVGPGTLRVVDWLFTLGIRGDEEEMSHENATPSPT
jgi:CHASE2 domain